MRLHLLIIFFFTSSTIECLAQHTSALVDSDKICVQNPDKQKFQIDTIYLKEKEYIFCHNRGASFYPVISGLTPENTLKQINYILHSNCLYFLDQRLTSSSCLDEHHQQFPGGSSASFCVLQNDENFLSVFQDFYSWIGGGNAWGVDFEALTYDVRNNRIINSYDLKDDFITINKINRRIKEYFDKSINWYSKPLNYPFIISPTSYRDLGLLVKNDSIAISVSAYPASHATYANYIVPIAPISEINNFIKDQKCRNYQSCEGRTWHEEFGTAACESHTHEWSTATDRVLLDTQFNGICFQKLDSSDTDILWGKMYKNGLPDGLEVHYYSNKQVRKKGYNKKGVKIGYWEYYDKNNFLRKKIIYDQEGKKVKEQNYFAGEHPDDFGKWLGNYRSWKISDDAYLEDCFSNSIDRFNNKSDLSKSYFILIGQGTSRERHIRDWEREFGGLEFEEKVNQYSASYIDFNQDFIRLDKFQQDFYGFCDDEYIEERWPDYNLLENRYHKLSVQDSCILNNSQEFKEWSRNNIYFSSPSTGVQEAKVLKIGAERWGHSNHIQCYINKNILLGEIALGASKEELLGTGIFLEHPVFFREVSSDEKSDEIKSNIWLYFKKYIIEKHLLVEENLENQRNSLEEDGIQLDNLNEIKFLNIELYEIKSVNSKYVAIILLEDDLNYHYEMAILVDEEGNFVERISAGQVGKCTNENPNEDNWNMNYSWNCNRILGAGDFDNDGKTDFLINGLGGDGSYYEMGDVLLKLSSEKKIIILNNWEGG